MKAEGILLKVNFYSLIKFVDPDANSEITFSFRCPFDFVSFVSIKLIWFSAAASGNMYDRIGCIYGSVNELKDTHIETPALGTIATSGANKWNVTEPANPLTLSSLTAGDYMGLRVARDSQNVNDTLNADVYVLGLLFTYTANQ